MEKIKQDILLFFKGLTFDEASHSYTANGKPLTYSVSGLIKKLTIPFDAQAVSAAMSRNSDLSQDEILQSWKTKGDLACKKGNEAHLFGELYPFNRHIKPRTPQEHAIVKFWNDIPEFIVPVIMELQMYHKEYLFAGTSDILLYNKQTGAFILGDYKSNADLFKNYKCKKLLSPFNFLLDNPFNKYQIQLSLYQILLEQLNLKIEKRRIVWLRDDGNYLMYDTQDFTKELLNILPELC